MQATLCVARMHRQGNLRVYPFPPPNMKVLLRNTMPVRYSPETAPDAGSSRNIRNPGGISIIVLETCRCVNFAGAVTCPRLECSGLLAVISILTSLRLSDMGQLIITLDSVGIISLRGLVSFLHLAFAFALSNLGSLRSSSLLGRCSTRLVNTVLGRGSRDFSLRRRCSRSTLSCARTERKIVFLLQGRDTVGD
jgi:hypothetical protein